MCFAVSFLYRARPTLGFIVGRCGARSRPLSGPREAVLHGIVRPLLLFTFGITIMEDTCKGPVTFDTPDSPQEARQRLSELRDHIRDIQNKLASHTPNGTGSATSSRWQDVALRALLERKQELEHLQEWLHKSQIQKTAETLEVDLDQADDVIRVANNLIQTLQNENRAELTEFETRMVDLVRFYVLEKSSYRQ